MVIRKQFATKDEARDYLFREGWYHEGDNTYYQHHNLAGMPEAIRYGKLVEHVGFVEVELDSMARRRSK